MTLLHRDRPQNVGVEAPLAGTPGEDLTGGAGEIAVDAGHQLAIGLLGEVIPDRHRNPPCNDMVG
ncbi:MAG: hypothetical protein WCB57_13700 [Pseudonocardiaceae bacterium]